MQDHDFDKLDSIISEIRWIREKGARPSLVKECDLCLFKKEHLQEVVEYGGLSLIRDVGYTRESRLIELGIEDVPSLAGADVDTLWNRWRKIDSHAPGLTQLKRMKLHAQAWLDGVPKIVGNGVLPCARPLIFIDLEYGQSIFLVGILILEEGENTTACLEFAESVSHERAILANLCDVLRRFPSAPVITWNGDAADIPQLQRAWRRLRLPDADLQDLLDRHIDLYQVAYNNVRLPINGLGLKEVSEHFGFERKHRDLSGIMMPFMYQEYLLEDRKRDKANIRETIIEYNKDDLEALALVYHRLADIIGVSKSRRIESLS